MTTNLQDKSAFFKYIAERVRLREGPVGVEKVLRAIFDAQIRSQAEPADGRMLARIVRLPLPVINAMMAELQSVGAVDPSGPGICLSAVALKAAQEAWGWALPRLERQSPASAGCQACGGTGITALGPQWNGVLEALRRNLTKSHVSPETIVQRVAFMHESRALAGKDVLVMGEDVSAAVAIALAGKALSQSGRLARRVVALHPEERVLSEVRDVAVREGVIVGLVKHDPRRSLMEDLEGEFDTVFVAPSAIFSSIIDLLSRTIEAAKPQGGQVFLACPPLSLDDRIDAQRAILDLGLAIERLVPGFDRYEGSKQPSDMYVLSVTEDAVVAEEVE
jgi:predicted methyltransferase